MKKIEKLINDRLNNLYKIRNKLESYLLMDNCDKDIEAYNTLIIIEDKIKELEGKNEKDIQRTRRIK